MELLNTCLGILLITAAGVSALTFKLDDVGIIKSIALLNQVHTLMPIEDYGLLGEILSIDALNLESLHKRLCQRMCHEDILRLISARQAGRLSQKQFESILAPICLANWSTKAWWSLSHEDLSQLPSNVFMSRDVFIDRMSPLSYDFFAKQAAFSNHPEDFKWHAWTANVAVTSELTPQNNWNLLGSGTFWQTITWKSIAQIHSGKARTPVIEIIGLSYCDLSEISTPGLVQRMYTLLSMVTHVREELKADNLIIRYKFKQLDFNKILEANILRLFNRLQKELGKRTDSQMSMKALKTAVKIAQNELNGVEMASVLEVFYDFLNASKTIAYSDWFIAIVKIMKGRLSSLGVEEWDQFFAAYFVKQPTISAISEIFRAFSDERVEEGKKILLNYSSGNAVYLKGMLENSIELPNNYMQLIPLVQRLKMQFRASRLLSDNFGRSINVSDLNVKSTPVLRKFAELVRNIGSSTINLNNNLFVGEEGLGLSVVGLVNVYFGLFVKLPMLYDVVTVDEDTARPVIIISPLFLAPYWKQFGYFMTLACLLKQRLPFILDFNMIEAALNPRKSETKAYIRTISETWEKERNRSYDYALTNNLKYMDLKSFDRWLSGLKKPKTSSAELLATPMLRSSSSFSNMGVLKRQRRLSMYAKPEPKRASDSDLKGLQDRLAELENEKKSKAILTIFSHGMEQLGEGIRYGFKLKAFSTEEMHQLIFYCW